MGEQFAFLEARRDDECDTPVRPKTGDNVGKMDLDLEAPRADGEG